MAEHNHAGLLANDDARLIKLALLDRAEDLFRLAWGEPVRSGKEWRPKSNSGLSMAMRGPKRGQWHDFVSGTGGDIFDFYAVNVLGLSAAKDDFPQVLSEAAKFCGIAPGEPVDLSALLARKASQEVADKQSLEKEAQRKASDVREIQARSVPLKGTPAEIYLSSRGIDVPPDGWSYMDGALVVWGLDDEGKIIGGQRILIREDGSRLINEDGSKAHKRGFGYNSGNPARIPAKQPGGPLIVCEGPETAAAIAQATGWETWAVFGVSFFKSAPIPTDRDVVFCPDQDAPDSPAAKQFTGACEFHVARDVSLWIARAPEPEGSKNDFADTLVNRGPRAVNIAIDNAVKFAPRPRNNKGQYTGTGVVETDTPAEMPYFMSAEEGRAKIRTEIETFLNAVVQHQNEPQYNEDGTFNLRAFLPPPVLAIATSAGSGKSTIGREVMSRFDLDRLNGDVIFYTPTLELAGEAANGLHVTRGRSAIDPYTGKPMCKRSVLAEKVFKSGFNVKSTLCEREDAQCPHFKGCRYLMQWHDLPNKPVLRFEAHAYLDNGDGSGRDIGLQIIDESIFRTHTHVADLTFDKWTRPREGEAEVFNLMTTAAAEVLAKLQKGESPLDLRYTEDDYVEFADRECQNEVLKTRPDATDDALNADLEKHSSHASGKLLRRVWLILADCKSKALATTERLRLVRDVPGPGKGEPRDVLRVTWFSEPKFDKRKPTLLLDADATEEITRRRYPNAEIVKINIRPNAEIIQITDKTFSKLSVLDREGRDNSNKRAELIHLVKAEVSKSDGGVLVAATKGIVETIFEDAGHDFSDMKPREISTYMRDTELHGASWLWFGPAALGLNAYEDFETVIVFGREELPVEVLEDNARAIFGDQGEPLQMVEGRFMDRQIVPVLMKDGSAVGLETTVHPDPRIRELQLQNRECSTRQVIERLRLVNAKTPKRVIIASTVPIPGLPVDRLMKWDEIMPTRFEQAMLEAAGRGGVLRLSAAGLSQDAPDTFPSQKAASRWLEKEGGREAFNTPSPVIIYPIRGEGVLKPVRVRFRPKGQRGGKPIPAIVVMPGNPREIAEAQLGPLSMFEVVESPPATQKRACLGKMTLDEAIKLINEAPKGKAIEVAHAVIDKLSEEDRQLAAGDLEEMAIVEDYS